MRGSGLWNCRRAARQMRCWRGRSVGPVKDSPHICHCDRQAGWMEWQTDRQADSLAGWLPDARPTCGCGLDLLVKLCHLPLHPSSPVDFKLPASSHHPRSPTAPPPLLVAPPCANARLLTGTRLKSMSSLLLSVRFQGG